MEKTSDTKDALHGAVALFAGAVDRFERFLLVLCTLMIIVVAVLAATEIVTRTLLRTSSIEVVDLSLQLSIITYFVGYAVLLNRGEDIEIDYFYRRFPAGLRRAVDLFTNIAILIFFAVVFVKSITLFQLGMRFRHPVFPIPNAVVIVPALLGSAVCLLIAFKRALMHLLPASVEPSPPPHE
jgi:TRAP-type C4-dicarboxylate transport system permease small subunit